VQNYPLCFTIPCTQYILLFSLMNQRVILRKKLTDVNSVKIIVVNTVIIVTVATLIFILGVLLYNSKPNSTTTH